MSSQTPAAEAGGTPGKRMTLSHVLELMLARNAGERSSVTLTRNAKGETQIDVVVRTDDVGGIPTADAAFEKAVELYDKARRQYPMQDGHTGGAPK